MICNFSICIFYTLLCDFPSLGRNICYFFTIASQVLQQENFVSQKTSSLDWPVAQHPIPLGGGGGTRHISGRHCLTAALISLAHDQVGRLGETVGARPWEREAGNWTVNLSDRSLLFPLDKLFFLRICITKSIHLTDAEKASKPLYLNPFERLSSSFLNTKPHLLYWKISIWISLREEYFLKANKS